MNKWRSFVGTFPDWPTVVGIVDCTPFRIRKPTGQLDKVLIILQFLIRYLSLALGSVKWLITLQVQFNHYTTVEIDIVIS